jgi:hypothetical protein
MATVVGVDQRFADISDGRLEPEHGVTAYADIEDALPHLTPHFCPSRSCCPDLVDRDARCLELWGLNADNTSESRCFLCPYDMYQHLSG